MQHAIRYFTMKVHNIRQHTIYHAALYRSCEALVGSTLTWLILQRVLLKWNFLVASEGGMLDGFRV